MVEAALAGDYARARELHHTLAPLVRQLFVETNPIPVKEAMAIRGYGPANLRLPLTRMGEDSAAELERILADLSAREEPLAAEADQ
jgi:4-hydroxy-tetrahydrodipicolinate synthase